MLPAHAHAVNVPWRHPARRRRTRAASCHNAGPPTSKPIPLCTAQINHRSNWRPPVFGNNISAYAERYPENLNGSTSITMHIRVKSIKSIKYIRRTSGANVENTMLGHANIVGLGANGQYVLSTLLWTSPAGNFVLVRLSTQKNPCRFAAIQQTIKSRYKIEAHSEVSTLGDYQHEISYSMATSTNRSQFRQPVPQCSITPVRVLTKPSLLMLRVTNRKFPKSNARNRVGDQYSRQKFTNTLELNATPTAAVKAANLTGHLDPGLHLHAHLLHVRAHPPEPLAPQRT